MAKVVLEGVTKSWGSVTAVKGIDLVIEDREFLVLVGPSGCGKSTVLRMVAGLEEPTEGSVYIGNRRVNDVAPPDRDVAMVFQNYALYPHMNVYENMAFGLRLRHFPKEEVDRRVREAARILGIEQLLNRRPRELSGGQRQRVALGRAIVREPQVFLMDEPLSNLDAKLRVQMRAELIRLHERLNITFIYVTHDQTEAMTMGDRIVVLKDGGVQQVGTPQEVYDHPANQFVAGFIGAPAMNFLPARLVEGDAGDVPTRGAADTGALRGSTARDAHRLLAVGEGFQLPLPERHTDRFADFVGKEVVVGIRPEAAYPLREEASASGTPLDGRNGFLKGTLEVREMMGAETLLHLQVGGETLVVRVDARDERGLGPLHGTVTLGVDVERVQIFDPASEVNLLREDG